MPSMILECLKDDNGGSRSDYATSPYCGWLTRSPSPGGLTRCQRLEFGLRRFLSASTA